MKINEPVTLFLEKPATFEVTILSEIGKLMAKTHESVKPTIRPARSSSLSFQMRIVPITATMMLRIMPIIREDGTKVAMVEVMTKNTIWAPPWGICITRALRSENPKPAMMIDENYDENQYVAWKQYRE
jgi:hypothetical protein